MAATQYLVVADSWLFSGDNCDQYLLTGDSIDSLYVGHHGKENDLDCSFQFTQHPLVVSLFYVYYEGLMMESMMIILKVIAILWALRIIS